jgi:hypothetical protein
LRLGRPAANPRISGPVMNVSCAGTHGSSVMTTGIVTVGARKTGRAGAMPPPPGKAAVSL